MIALGGPKLKHVLALVVEAGDTVSMIALGGPKLKLEFLKISVDGADTVSMIALGGPKLKPQTGYFVSEKGLCFNDSTGWA